MPLNTRPSRFLITRLARAYGFMDPIALLSQLRRFARPSEVGEPIELLRAGVLFHARGLLNTKAIQHNLDWVWPYWVEQQFNPDSPSFIPRAFSFSHINLTHRNWTAVGVPDVPYYPIVDPRGLVTPLYDGWSLDFWLISDEPPLLPSKLADFEQELLCRENLVVRSTAARGRNSVTTEVSLALIDGAPECRIQVDATSGPARSASLIVALRPYNPEGVSLVNRISADDSRRRWCVNERHPLHFDRAPADHRFSNYEGGDVFLRLDEDSSASSTDCAAGMATAAAVFPFTGTLPTLQIRVPIFDELAPRKRPGIPVATPWIEAREELAHLHHPDPDIQRLWNQAAANLILHIPGEVYPGPYTYKRFWFRDAAFILYSALTLGDTERVRRALAGFAWRQRRDGYFLSQEGEWDSNGEALWFYAQFARFTGETLTAPWLDSIARGARWITRKRLPAAPDRPEAGLLPAGFSAEHLGPNDHYYWDDFWGVAGFRAAASLLSGTRHHELGLACAREADEFLRAIDRSFPRGPHRRFPEAIPASPYRRMDSGAIGSLVADHPLQLYPPGHTAMLRTAEYLHAHSFRQGAFFQDMIHSGLNAYLTLHVAQVFLRAGRPEPVWQIVDRIAALASPTGQWPEAIHPRTLGGCMGDGQHIWAAAEWLLLIRNLFIREEGDGLVLGAGLRREWIEAGEIKLGPVLTPHGEATIHFAKADGSLRVHLAGRWRKNGPPLREFRVPGYTPRSVPAGDPESSFLLHPLP